MNEVIIGAVILVALIVFVVISVIIWVVLPRRRSDRGSIDSVLACLKGTQNPNEITIDTEGDVQDNMLSTTVVANSIVTRVGENMRMLVFASVIMGKDPESIQQMLTLLRAASLLNINIDWVNDVVPNKWIDDIITRLTKYSLRCDHLLKDSDINIRDLNDYSVILHPKAGMKGSYEIVARTIKLLSDDSTTLPE